MIKFKLFGFDSEERALPMPVPKEETDRPSWSDETQANPQAKRVLIVDDDLVFLRVTAAKLRSAGFRVKMARESSEAIAALGEEPMDAVLLDINFAPDVCHGGMGSWDGFQLLSWLRGFPTAKGARFIMVSNSDAAADRQRALQLGAAAYFQKPLDHDQLFALVNAEN
jgi:two-component system, chemotaxis family, sensor histidine kinase and response regulator PixL